jgi:hypothetical protein
MGSNLRNSREKTAKNGQKYPKNRENPKNLGFFA